MKHDLIALILAAGKGTRFKSDKIKILHTLLNRPMLQWIVEAVGKLKPEIINIVVGHQKEEVSQKIVGKKIHFIVQKDQLGTGHAVMSACKILKDYPDKDLLVINGDLPLIRTETLRPFLKFHRGSGNSLTFMTAELENPIGFGRLIKTEDEVLSIIEEKDATPVQRRLKEINVGIYLFKIKDLLSTITRLSNNNKKNEYYLTDMIEIMGRAGKAVAPFKTPYTGEIVGVNDRYEMARALDILRKRKIEDLSLSGVTIFDPATTWIDQDVRIGRDTVIYPSVIIEEKTVIGGHCTLFPFVHIRSSRIGDKVRILTSTVIEESTIKENAQVGPFSHLRPKTIINEGAKVGNFVEMKNTIFGSESKACHLSYLGDTDVGEKVNIGAGTITCNFDGRYKNRTLIDPEAFIGSGTQLIAPVKIGKGAYVGAGSTITKNVSPDSLAVARSRQSEKPGWARRKKKKT